MDEKRFAYEVMPGGRRQINDFCAAVQCGLNARGIVMRTVTKNTRKVWLSGADKTFLGYCD